VERDHTVAASADDWDAYVESTLERAGCVLSLVLNDALPRLLLLRSEFTPDRAVWQGAEVASFYRIARPFKALALCARQLEGMADRLARRELISPAYVVGSLAEDLRTSLDEMLAAAGDLHASVETSQADEGWRGLHAAGRAPSPHQVLEQLVPLIECLRIAREAPHLEAPDQRGDSEMPFGWLPERLAGLWRSLEEHLRLEMATWGPDQRFQADRQTIDDGLLQSWTELVNALSAGDVAAVRDAACRVSRELAALDTKVANRASVAAARAPGLAGEISADSQTYLHTALGIAVNAQDRLRVRQQIHREIHDVVLRIKEQIDDDAPELGTLAAFPRDAEASGALLTRAGASVTPSGN
jgi:hypothetical protein